MLLSSCGQSNGAALLPIEPFLLSQTPRPLPLQTLVGFSEGDDLIEAAWATARCSARLGFLILEAAVNPPGAAAGERRVRLGDGTFRRKPSASQARGAVAGRCRVLSAPRCAAISLAFFLSLWRA